jgi:hypothetical protein
MSYNSATDIVYGIEFNMPLTSASKKSVLSTRVGLFCEVHTSGGKLLLKDQ